MTNRLIQGGDVIFVRFVQSLFLMSALATSFQITAATPTSVQTISLVEALKEDRPGSYTDEKGKTHQLYYSTSHPEFLRLIETSIIDLSRTGLGKSLLQHVLACDSSSISKHFGISSQTANMLAGECFRDSLINKNLSTYVLESQDDKLETKISLIPGTSKRQYILVVSESTDWNIDSWTDPFSNKTVFIVEKGQADKADSKTFFYQMMAHEIAVYFDTKAWVGSAEWDDIPTFKNSLNDVSVDKNKLALALNNPLISQMLRSLRAFRIEKVFIEELVSKNLLPRTALSYYQHPGNSYLEEDCHATCVLNFLNSFSALLLPQSLPLLAFSPQYRNQKALEIIGGRSLGSSNKTVQVLENYPDQYLTQIFKNDPFFNMMNPDLKPGQEYLFRETSETFKTILLPQDLSTISQLMKTNHILDEDFLSFLASPQLGGQNVRLSGGPRPRIRGGKEVWYMYIFGPGGYLFEHIEHIEP